MNCTVCHKSVPYDGDMNFEGTRAIAAPVEGQSVKCETCCEIVHPQCSMPEYGGVTGPFCTTCTETFDCVIA